MEGAVIKVESGLGLRMDRLEFLEETLEEVFDFFESIVKGIEVEGLFADSFNKIFEEFEVEKGVSLLNLVPEAISPTLYYPWVERTFTDTELAFKWHIERVLQIDQTTGRLDLCRELLNLGVNRLGLVGLKEKVEKVGWLEELACYSPETFSETFREEVSRLVDPSLEEIFSWETHQYAQRLHRLVTFGASPSILIKFLLKSYKTLCEKEDIWLSLLDLPQDGVRLLEEQWGSSVETLFVKACFLGLIVGKFSSRKAIAVIGLLERLTTLPNKASPDIILSKLDAELVVNIEASSQLYPIYKFITSHLPAWEIVEQYVSPLQPLPVLLARYLTGTSFQHRNWLNRFVRASVTGLDNLPEVLGFWGGLQQLGSIGFFGSITNEQLGVSLLEGLLGLDEFELVSNVCQEDSVLNLDSKTIESLVIAASQERFDNATSVTQSDPEIQAAFQCLECFPDLASPPFQAWNSFLNGALQLQEFASQSRMASLTPLEIRLHPRDQLLHVLNHPGSRLYRNMKLLFSIAKLLGIDDQNSLRISLFKVAEQRNDLTIAYNICLSILENQPSSEEIFTCISLARNQLFPDADKRARIVSLGVSVCSTSQCHQWLGCYRELEAVRSHHSNISLPQDLFRSQPSECISVLKHLLEGWATFPFSSPLREHPMYSNEISSSGDDLYDGTTHLAPPEYGYRLGCIVSDGISDPNLLCSSDLIKYWVQLACSPDPVWSTLHWLHLPKEVANQIVCNLPPTPNSALQTAYHYGLSSIPYLFKESNPNPPSYDITRLRPSEVIDLVHSVKMPPTKDPVLETYLVRGKEALNQVFERELNEHQNPMLDELGISKETFHTVPPSAKIAVLESQAFQLGINRLDTILQLAYQSNIEPQPLILAHMSGFFMAEEMEFKTVEYWQQVIRPRLSTLDGNTLRNNLESCYEVIDGTQLSLITLINEAYIDSMKDMEINPTQQTILHQLELRNNIIIPWISFLGSKTINFKRIVSGILSSSVSSIPALFAPLFSPDIIDAVAAQVEQLVQIQAIFEFEFGYCVDLTPTLSNVDVFTSIIYYGYLEFLLTRMTKDLGLILPDNLVPYTDQAFPHMLQFDLINILSFICSPNCLETIPVISAKAALQSAQDNFTLYSKHSPEWESFQNALVPFQTRLQFLEELSELTDPIDEEDLGFFNIQLIDKVDLLSNDAMDSLFRQLLRFGLSPFLIQKVACLVSSHYPDSLVGWRSDPLHGLINSNNTPIVAYIIRSFFQTNQLENQTLNFDLDLDFLKQLGNTLKLYDFHHVKPWAEATIESIKTVIYERILLDSSLAVSTREEVLFILYDNFGLCDFDNLEVLLEWRCSLIASPALNSSLQVKSGETLGLLSDLDWFELWIENLLTLPHYPSYVLDILIIASRFYQLSTGSSSLNSSLSKLWVKTMAIIAKSHGQEQLDLYALWMFCVSILDLDVINEEYLDLLAVLYQHSPLYYYQLGLSTRNEGLFHKVVSEYVNSPREDLGIDFDPIIVALLICRDQIVTLVKACPGVMERVVAPLLLDRLDDPYLQRHALFCLVKLLPDQAEFLSESLKTIPGSLSNKEPGSVLLQQLTSNPPLPKCGSFDQLGGSIPTMDDLSGLLSGPLLPSFSAKPREYIHHIIRTFIPSE